MKARIALFTANVQGGILQLTVQLYKTLVEEGYDVKVVMPCEIHDIDISLIAKTDLLQYHKEKKVIDRSTLVLPTDKELLFTYNMALALYSGVMMK